MSSNTAKVPYWDHGEEAHAPSAERVNILVVDDLPEKLLAYEAILEDMGQNLMTVRSGEEALRLVLREEFAVILLDVNMPGMDGFETASLIRQRKKSSHTPIIFLTAFTDEVRMAQGYASGAVDYLPTPVVPEILKAKVRVFIELSRMRRQAALQAEEHAMRTAAEESARRSDFLVNAGEALTHSLNEADILSEVAGLPIPYLADLSLLWCAPKDMDPAIIYRVWAKDNEAISELSNDALSPRLEKAIAEVMVLGRPIVVNGGFADRRVRAVETALLVPIRQQQQIHAVLIIARERKMPYQLHEIDLVKELASRASVALERAMLMRRIQDADRRKDEFLAMLAHELRNPLAPIANALEAMRRNPKRLEEAQAIIARQLDHMIHLVDDLMDVSRITQGKIELRKEPVTLRAVLQHALETSHPLITQRNHQLNVHLPEQEIWLEADISRISQIFSNLLNNAAKYTNEQGRIDVTVTQECEVVHIAICDNGIGIPAEQISSVFDLFAQVDSSLERAQGGLGIGLTLVKNLLQLQEGSIRAYSAGVGKGSQFIVTLPVIVPPIALDTHTKDEAMSKPEGLRILIVDDNVASAQTMGWMMEFEGHDYRLAHDGKDAIALARDYVPDVVLLDIGLPDMNGYDICKAMKQESTLKKTLFIAQTGWGQEEHRLRSKEAGFDHHLVKPIKLEALQKIFPIN